jgi:hypothetical protein
MIKVDPEDRDILAACSWSPNEDGYPVGWYKGRIQYLHLVIMRRHHTIPEGMEVDHKDGDKLDCRKSEMRIVTRSVNMHNKGQLCVTNRYGKYQAKVTLNRKPHWLGTFTTYDAAADAVYRFKQEHGLLVT